MSLSVEVLLRDPSGHLSDYQKDCLQGIHGEIRKMADLIATLLDVSKIQLGNFVVERKLADVLPAAEAALERVLPELNGKGLKLIKSFAGSIPSVLSDKNIIQVVLENLLSNAVKYTPPQGLITVSIRKQRNRILITVKDNGCGIPKGQQHRIFSKYFRAGNALMREAQGVGLGLYMCKLLIESVAGRIWFESRENEGATFYVSLPLAAPAQPSL
jgi:signal transduction histidine kinase